MADLLAAVDRHDDLYIDHGVSGDRAPLPQSDRALDALIAGDTLAVTALDRLGALHLEHARLSPTNSAPAARA